MKTARIVSVAGLLAMTAVLIYGFTIGDFRMDGGQILRNPWGIVSLVDLYVGFALFSLWIIFREGSKLAAIIWTVLMMVLGFWAGSLYVVLAINSSQGDWLRFFLGARRDTLLSNAK